MGRPGKSKAKAKAPSAAALAKAAANAVFVWAQCDNAGCQKWRKLPPGTKIDETNPWFCYMNPDEDWARCSKSEEYYNKDIEAGFEASSLFHPQLAQTPESARKPASKRRREEGMSTRQRAGKAKPGRRNSSRSLSDDDYDPEIESLPDQPLSTAKRRRHGLAEPGSEEEELVQDEGRARQSADHKQRIGRHSHAGPDAGTGRDAHARAAAKWHTGAKAQRAQQNFQKLLAGGGEWEVSKGPGKAVTPSPGFVWEALWAFHPHSAQTAVDAADAASAAQYFEGGAAASNTCQKGALLARLALASAAAAALDRTPGQAARQAAAAAPAHRPGTQATQQQQQQHQQQQQADPQQASFPPLQQGAEGQASEPAARRPAVPAQDLGGSKQPEQQLGHPRQHPHSTSHHRPPDSPAASAVHPAVRQLQQQHQQQHSQPLQLPSSVPQPAAILPPQLQAPASSPAAIPSPTASAQPHPGAASVSHPPPQGFVPAGRLPPSAHRPPAGGSIGPAHTAQPPGSAVAATSLPWQPHGAQTASLPTRQVIWPQAQVNGHTSGGSQLGAGQDPGNAARDPEPHIAVGAKGVHQPSHQEHEDVYAGEAWPVAGHAVAESMNGYQDLVESESGVPYAFPASAPELPGSYKAAHAGVASMGLLEAMGLPNGHKPTHRLDEHTDSVPRGV